MVASPATTTTTTLAPAAPTLSYSLQTAVFVYSDVNSSLSLDITPLTPTVIGAATGFAISPNLTTNTGLSFNATSGIISGKATLTSAATVYTVTVTGAAGSSTTSISIRTGPGFLVNSNLDTSDSSTADNICATAASVCTLRAAIVQVNAMSTAISRLIVVPAQTTTLGSQLDVTNKVEIVGASAATSIVSANGGAYVAFTVLGATSIAIISNLSIENSATGGILVGSSGNLSLKNSIVQNHAGFGGIYAGNPSTATIDSSNFFNNAAGIGGGIQCYVNTVCNITNSTFTGNTASNSGGAIANFGAMTIQSSYIGNNNVLSGGSQGGAIYVHSVASLTSIVNSTIYGNSSWLGGAIGAESLTSIVNSTIANNVTTYYSGASSNLYGGFSLKNSILYNNRNVNGALGSCSGSAGIVTAGNNLSDTSLADCNLNGAGDLVSTNALLSLPADNGGPNFTMALAAGSPAINAGSSSGAPAVDQRGVVRSGLYDSGAFEGVGTSAAMDIIPPATNATALGWTTASPSATLSNTATWTVSNSIDVVNQKFQLYSGAGCTNPVWIQPANIGSATTNTYTFSGTNLTTYSYRILSFDSVGNFNQSACSTDLYISL